MDSIEITANVLKSLLITRTLSYSPPQDFLEKNTHQSLAQKMLESIIQNKKNNESTK